MRRRSLLRWVLGALLPAARRAHGQQPLSESAVKAAFLFKFASFVEWPAGVFQRPDQPLAMGVAGDEAVAADLEQIAAGRHVDSHPVVVRRVPESGPVTGVHVLYVGTQREQRLRENLAAVAGPVLLVTDQPDALKLGSVLNFSHEDGRIRFAASLTAAQARRLKLSSRLLAVAQNVEGRAP